MTHFISATTQGERCRCGAPATHKVGEKIPPDEPCTKCGSTWRRNHRSDSSDVSEDNDCPSTYHWNRSGGPASQRHELTAYVCCRHFTEVFGEATGCPADAAPALVPNTDGYLEKPVIMELHGKTWTLLQLAYADAETFTFGYFALEHVEGGGIKLPAVLHYIETKGPPI